LVGIAVRVALRTNTFGASALRAVPARRRPIVVTLSADPESRKADPPQETCGSVR
jgi:hypothetical protein